jgi:hypothetical protein
VGLGGGGEGAFYTQLPTRIDSEFRLLYKTKTLAAKTYSQKVSEETMKLGAVSQMNQLNGFWIQH